MANIGNILGKYWRMKLRVVMLKKLKLNIMSLKRKSFKLTRLSFNIKNITNLNMILQGFLKIINFSRYVISFLYRFSLGGGLFPPVRPLLLHMDNYVKI
jgi:hypothetical protein